jgi:hypothetical protein
MADEKSQTSGDGSAAPPDEIKNIKSEFARKTDNLQKMLEEQNKRSEAMLQAMIQMQQQKAAAQQDIASSEDEYDVGVDPIDDPKKFAAKVAAKAAEKATRQVNEQNAANHRVQQEQQAALLSLVSDYPELNDVASDLYKQALQLTNAMPDSYRNSSIGLKAAVREAAANLGVLPVSKRTKTGDTDDFSVDSPKTERKQRRNESEPEIDPNALAFAELLGQPVNDPKYLERLKQASKRKDWKRYK